MTNYYLLVCIELLEEVGDGIVTAHGRQVSTPKQQGTQSQSVVLFGAGRH